MPCATVGTNRDQKSGPKASKEGKAPRGRGLWAGGHALDVALYQARTLKARGSHNIQTGQSFNCHGWRHCGSLPGKRFGGIR